MKNSLKHCVVLLLSFISMQSFGDSYEINGTLKGAKNGSWLFLRIKESNQIIDSTQIINEKFILKGKINDSPVEVILHDKSFSNYIFLWLENVPILLKGMNKNFCEANVNGGPILNESSQLFKSIYAIEAEQKVWDKKLKALNLKGKPDRNDIMRQIFKSREKEKNAYIKHIETHPNSIVSAAVLAAYATAYGKTESTRLYKLLSKAIQETRYGQQILQTITLNGEIVVGKKFIDFEQPTTTGELVKLSSIKARYLLLEFWAAWCSPCRRENPELINSYNEFKDKGFDIFAVSLDRKKEDWLYAIAEDKLPWRNVSDLKVAQNSAALIYGVSAVPRNFLIDENGIVVAIGLRGEKLNNKLKELLN
ncbi:redoxin domain-containing protein [Pedobacter sp. KLB.chiD]|uniref:redoxin domain-containing protein n=1 Tax=Pedobacter sp. KLB.chiD TaxID=3387402 RepID=UPI00399A19A1